jgi:hypothetical protein
MPNPKLNLASIVEVCNNADNQEYYNNAAESVSGILADIMQDRADKNLKGAVVLGLDFTTIPKDLHKTGNPFWDKPKKKWNIVKQTHLTAIVDFNYENAVNGRLKKEGKESDFEAMPRSWGVRMAGTPYMVEHTNKDGIYRRYLSICCCGYPKSKYFAVSPNFREVPKSEIEAFIPPEPEGRQGLDKTVIYRDVACDSINEISYLGVFEVRDIVREMNGENVFGHSVEVA